MGSGDLEDMRRGTVFEIAAMVFAIAWVMMVGSYGSLHQSFVAFILLACSAVSLWLRWIDFRIAVAWLIATLVAAIACQKWLYRSSPAQHYAPVVVVVSTLLVSSLNVFVVAALCGATLLALARWQGVD